MDLNFSFEKKEQSDSESGTKPKYFKEAIADYSKDMALKDKVPTYVMFGQPVENRQIYSLEQRPGCDLASRIINWQIKSSRIAYSDKLEALNLVSFLGHYETNPLELSSKQACEFMQKEIIFDIRAKLEQVNKHLIDLQFIDIAGSIDHLLAIMSSHQKMLQSESACLVKISPQVYDSLLKEFTFPVAHIGLDEKFDAQIKVHKENGSKRDTFVYYDIEKGADDHLRALEDAFSNHDFVEVLIDCQVFSPEYFQGVSVPFPFSYSKQEISKIFKIIIQNKRKVKFLGICHYNPSVEKERSAAFLLDFIYNFITC
jgi:hypothetical protein